MILFVCSIHNNMLGACREVKSYEEGKMVIIQLAQEQLGRPLNDDEIYNVETYYYITDDEDGYCWSIGIVE